MNRDEAIDRAVASIKEAEEAALMASPNAAEGLTRVAEAWIQLAAILPGIDRPALMAAEPTGDLCGHRRGVVKIPTSAATCTWIHAVDGNLCDKPPTD